MGLADRLALDPTGERDVFVNREPTDANHVFGGWLVALALHASALTVESRLPCSLHASFVVGAVPGEPVSFAAERTRDGGSFSTRRVVASQRSRGPVLALTADFHVEEAGVEHELPAAVGVPGPDDLGPGRYDSPMFDSRDVPPSGTMPFERRAWFRAREPVGDEPLVHLLALAMLTDFGPTRAAREPHAHLSDDAARQSVSLDHSVWFHRPARVDEWLLSELVPVSTGRGRGLAMGTVRTLDGTLVASCAQEVLLRERRA